MIQKIKYIKNLGIFSDWTSPGNLILNKHNLFYGWNGSGKSTLSKLFRAIEMGQLPNHFPDVKFQLELLDTNLIDEKLNSALPILRVFNREFIDDNTKFEKGEAESIIYIGKDNKELKDEIDDKKKSHFELNENNTLLGAELRNRDALKEAFFTNSGSELKAFFLNTIYASNTYDKRNSARIWEDVRVGASLNDFILRDSTFERYKSFIAQGQRKPKNELSVKKFSADLDNKLYNEITALISKNPVIKTIDRLKTHPDIAQWVQQGLNIHRTHNSLSCEFCNQRLPEDKLNNISDHFNQEFLNLQKELSEKKQEVQNLFVLEMKPDLTMFHADKAPYVINCIKTLNEYGAAINEGLNGYLNLLLEKERNPLKLHFSTTNIGGSIVVYNQQVDEFEAIVKAHNKDVEDYESVADKYRIEIEKHYVAKKAISESLINLIGEIAQLRKEIEEKVIQLKELKSEITNKELELQNDTIAIEAINRDLTYFLGREEIKLEKNQAGGYIIRRNEGLAINLSEGEKTAIALIYFIAKIKEKDNVLENTIVVFDDPISSLDSNHLFNAAHFLKKEFYSEDEAKPVIKQLIILTHNFYFFSLIKECLEKKLAVFSIKTYNKNGKREAAIEKAESVLAYFNSEYHFLFSQMNDYCQSADKSYYHTHTIANISRQVLESFLSFKYGRKKLEKCFDEISGFPDLAKVRKFVSHYSHRATHGSNINGFNDNVFAETPVIIPLVLKLIEHVDQIHYNSMMARINNN